MASPNPSSPQKNQSKENTPVKESRRTSKSLGVKVIFLDNSSHIFNVQTKALGQELFTKVCKYLNLLEVDYFGLEYEDDKKTKYWLDALKPMSRQTGLQSASPTMYFSVKFYTPDPVQLEDEFTRYLFSLQVKKDLAAGLLQCNDNTAALMVSYIIQADCIDYDGEEDAENSYLSANKFIPYQDAALQRKIIENHKKLIGQTPEEADLNLLETSRRCELYGIKMTPAKDHEGVPLNLAVAHLGVLVFQNFTKINTFSWAKIRKLSFKRKRFLIKLHPEGYGYYKDTVEFFFEGRNECKNFWKKCIENHTFFRCSDAKKGMRQKPKIFSRGSSFRYSGRTQKQVSDFVRENYIKRQPFQRSTSLRTTPSSPSGARNPSISAQPMLPVASSVSCGSITAIAEGLSPPVLKKQSASEPSTPHALQDANQVLTNGCAVIEKQEPDENKQDASTGLTSPDFECDQDELQSPDFLGQDTDDNISHCSYRLFEMEACKIDPLKYDYSNTISNEKLDDDSVITGSVSSTKKAVYLIGNVNYDCSETCENKSRESGVQTHKQTIPNGDIPYRLKKCPKDGAHDFESRNSRKMCRPRVRVEFDRQWCGQISPTLYARANRVGCSTAEHQESGFPKSRPRTMDFVLVNQLPSIGSFSYKDDSIEIKSPDKAKLELLRQKLLENNIGTPQNLLYRPKTISCNASFDQDIAMYTTKFKSTESIITVLEQPSCSNQVDTNISEDNGLGSLHNFKEMPDAVHDAGLGISDMESPELSSCVSELPQKFSDLSEQSINSEYNLSNITFHSTLEKSEGEESNKEILLMPFETELLSYTGFQREYQIVYREADSEDLVDSPNQYSYASYKFMQIDRPRSVSLGESSFRNRNE